MSAGRPSVNGDRLTGLLASAGELRVACNLVCYRAKNGKVDTYFGHALYGLDVSGPQWRIIAKRVMLDMDLLYPGKVSILL